MLGDEWAQPSPGTLCPVAFWVVLITGRPVVWGRFVLDHLYVAIYLGIIKISHRQKESHFSCGLTGTVEVEKVLLISRVRS